MLANKCRHPSDTDAIEEYCSRHGLELIGVLPWSEAVLDADALSKPLLDHNPSDPVVDALAALVGGLVHGTPPRPEPVSGPQVEAGV